MTSSALVRLTFTRTRTKRENVRLKLKVRLDLDILQLNMVIGPEREKRWESSATESDPSNASIPRTSRAVEPDRGTESGSSSAPGTAVRRSWEITWETLGRTRRSPSSCVTTSRRISSASFRRVLGVVVTVVVVVEALVEVPQVLEIEFRPRRRIAQWWSPRRCRQLRCR